MKNSRFKLFVVVSLLLTSMSAKALVFGPVTTVGDIRQTAGPIVQISLGSGAIANNCSTKPWAVALEISHPNFKNFLASILTARASGSEVQFVVEDNGCFNGFALMDTFTLKK